MRPWTLLLLAGSAAAQATPPPAPPKAQPAPAQPAARPSPGAAPAVVPPAQRERPADAKALFALFARLSGLEVRFQEAKHLALLALPLESKGKLYFLPPGYLTRVVEAPEPATLTITPDELRVHNRDGTEVVDLKRSDKVRTFVTALVQVFAGDEAGLRKSFDVAYEPDPARARAWKLRLTPRGKPLDQLMRSLELHGEGEAVVRIEMLEQNGDRTVTKIESADPERRFDAAERARLFGIEAR